MVLVISCLLAFICAFAAIAPAFPCEKLDRYDCQDIGYCYWNGTGCDNDTCLAPTDSVGTGCGAGCQVASYPDFGFNGPVDECAFILPFLHICTKRASSGVFDSCGISNCFFGMVLSGGVCSVDTYGDVDYCKNVTETFDDATGAIGATFTGRYCDKDVDWGCRVNAGTDNCKLYWGCAIVNGACIHDACYDNYPTAADCNGGCQIYSVYDYTGSGSSYTINSTEKICGKAEPKYGNTRTPNPCNYLRTSYSDYSADPCDTHNPNDPLPSSTAVCTVTGVEYCGDTYCDSDCSVDAYNNCTSASGISGVTCVVKSARDSDGDEYKFCSDGREYTAPTTGAALHIHTRSFISIFLAVVLVMIFS